MPPVLPLYLLLCNLPRSWFIVCINNLNKNNTTNAHIQYTNALTIFVIVDKPNPSLFFYIRNTLMLVPVLLDFF